MRLFTLLACLACAPLVAQEENNVLPQSIYDINMKTIDGQNVPLSFFRGRVLVIVNLSAKDPKAAIQIPQLQDLYDKYGGRSLVVLGFPCTDFTNDDTSTNSETQSLYQQKYHVTFPLFEKSRVTGPTRNPLYYYLTSSRTDPNYGWEVDWNFTKFIVDQNGTVVARFPTKTLPTDPKFTAALEKILPPPSPGP